MTDLQEFNKQDIYRLLDRMEDTISDLDAIISLAKSTKRALSAYRVQIRAQTEPDNTVAESSADKAYTYILDWISRNPNRFQRNENHGTVWGKIENGVAVINRYVLQEQLEKGGFDMTATLKKLDAKGKLIRNSQGYFTHQTRVFGQKANYVKIRIDQNAMETLKSPQKPV